MDEHEARAKRGWLAKFQTAFRGIKLGMAGPPSTADSGPNSFYVHLPVAVLVLIAGLVLQVGWFGMSALLLASGLVLVAELFNSSVEFLARAVTGEPDDNVGAALDVASGAVLVAALIAVVVGVAILGSRIWMLLFA
jgi:diacylglycerol kinase